MNYQMLTLQEILRVAEPESELEKRLIQLLTSVNGCANCQELEDRIAFLPTHHAIHELEHKNYKFKSKIKDLEDFILRVTGHE